MIRLLIIFLFAQTALIGCRSVYDPSIKASHANDKTLIGALIGGPCAALPSQGADICRFQEGSSVHGNWVLILPKLGKNQSGTIKVANRDFTKTYSITSNEVVIPLRDFYGNSKWRKGTSILSALAEFQYEDKDGIDRFVRAEGLALIVVLQSGYSPMPIDSGYHQYNIKCEKYKVQYSTAGRSAFGCR